MQVKKFEAPTMHEALDCVKRELGPEAIILQTKNNKRGFGLMSKGSVEITAAIAERSLNKKNEAPITLLDKKTYSLQNVQSQRENQYPGKSQNQYHDQYYKTASSLQDRVEFVKSEKPITTTPYIDILDSRTQQKENDQKSQLASEIENLKKMIEELKAHQKSSPSTAIPDATEHPLIQEAFEQLVMNGVERKYAFLLIKKVKFEFNEKFSSSSEYVLDLLAKEIMDSVQVKSIFAHFEQGPVSSLNTHGPEVITLVGPTGVGKTTTLAKLASVATQSKGLKVGLLNCDEKKPHAFDQLATYAKILNVPFRCASSPEDFKAALHDFHKLDLVFVDTSGKSQRDPDAQREIDKLLDIERRMKFFLVFSATTRDNELYDGLSRFLKLNPSGIIVSKLDEATVFGSVYNLSQKSKIPLVYFTIGQKIPDDLEVATPERVASLVMNI